MEKFLEPEILISKFDAADIITTSGDDMPIEPDDE